MAINYTAPVALSKAVLPAMVAKGKAAAAAGVSSTSATGRAGHIVVISSVQGKFGLPYRSSYSARCALHPSHTHTPRTILPPRRFKATALCLHI